MKDGKQPYGTYKINITFGGVFSNKKLKKGVRPVTWEELANNRDKITRIEITDWLNNTLYQFTPRELVLARRTYNELSQDQDVSFYVYIGREQCILDKE